MAMIKSLTTFAGAAQTFVNNHPKDALDATAFSVAMTAIMADLTPILQFGALSVTLAYGVLRVYDLWLSIKQKQSGRNDNDPA